MEMIKFHEMIEGASNIALASHLNPDGDNLGSLSALSKYLKKLNKEVYTIFDDVMIDDFKFLFNGIDTIKSSELKNIDLFITLDSAELNRIGKDAKDLYNNSKKTICIDHHHTNDGYADFNVIEKNASSTCEVLFKLLKKEIIDEEIATSILTGISTDTGSFKYENTSGDTHRIAAELLDLGAKNLDITVNVYQSNPKSKIMLLNEALSRLEFYSDGKIAFIALPKEISLSKDYKKSDSEGIVEYIRDIEGVEIAIFLKEKEDEIRVSFRAKSYADVSKIASKFSGGGHIMAAGATYHGELSKAKEEILNEAIKEIKCKES